MILQLIILLKYNVENSVLFSDQTEHIVISSVVSCARFYALHKIHKPTFAFHPIVPIVATTITKNPTILILLFSFASINKVDEKCFYFLILSHMHSLMNYFSSMLNPSNQSSNHYII